MGLSGRAVGAGPRTRSPAPQTNNKNKTLAVGAMAQQASMLTAKLVSLSFIENLHRGKI